MSVMSATGCSGFSVYLCSTDSGQMVVVLSLVVVVIVVVVVVVITGL